MAFLRPEYQAQIHYLRRPVSVLGLTCLGTFGLNVAERLVRASDELGRAGSSSLSIGSSSLKTVGIGMSAGSTSSSGIVGSASSGACGSGSLASTKR